MGDIIVRHDNLPDNIEDLSRFVLVGREKLTAVRAEIRAMEKVGLAKSVIDQKLSEGQDIADTVLDAEARLGELMANIQKATPNNNPFHEIDVNVDFVKPKSEVIKEAGLTQKQVERMQIIASHPDIVAAAKAEARENGDIVSRSLVLNMIRNQKKAEEIQLAEKAAVDQIAEAAEKPIVYIGNGIGYVPDEPYDLLLTDPPYSTDVENIFVFAAQWLTNALKYVKDTGSAYIFIGAYPKELKAYLQVKPPEHIQLEQVLVWTYKNTLGQNPNDRYKQNWQACLYYRGVNAPSLDCPLTTEQWAVQEVNAPDGRQGDRYHKWQKPMEICERFIRHSTRPGMTVFDPFACTGTSLLAAAKLGRIGYGFEICKDFAYLARRRGCDVREWNK